tara:strand:- start:11582 stop:12475 length:894 start_codon:yes stop_codon:yes gene_type:complete
MGQFFPLFKLYYIMAKKKTQEVVEEPQIETVVAEAPAPEPAPVVEKPKRQEPKRRVIDGWEVKDRMYMLSNGQSPLTYTIRSKGLYFYDEEKGYEREIGYAVNQNSPFVEEWSGQIRKRHITFENGSLFVPKEKATLQKFLSLYHPRRNKLYHEVDNRARRENQADYLEYELMAMNAANSMEIDMLEAIMRVETGSKVSKMTSKELKRDGLLFAKQNPQLFLELANDDNVYLRNVGIKAVEMRVIVLSEDQRYFSWASNNRKLMTVPFDEHPYTALGHWFKTDEGMEVFKSIEKRLK